MKDENCEKIKNVQFKDQIRPILDQVYVYAEKIIGIESIETMLSELKGVYDVLENV